MKVVVWGKDGCPACVNAKNLLNSKQIAFEERKIGHGYTRENLLEVAPNAKTVPQIFIDDELIGGYDELKVKFS